MSNEIPLPGVVTIEHSFEVPLDHDNPDGPRLDVFAREVAAHDGRDRPFLVYLQGGPGFEAPRPFLSPKSPPWLRRALEDFRILMLDQRGTGRSSPVGIPAGSPAEQADYLAHFRADSIVRDAELIRREMGAERWSILGQSFGGFCATAYLSMAPEGLREALITGGLPPLGRSIDEVYTHTYARTMERNRRYLKRYPQDRARLERLRQRLENEDFRLPSGERLTWRRFRQLGLGLGMSDGAEHLHYLLELEPDSPAFRHDVVALAGFPRNPIYAVLHEACYCDGGTTSWSADRLLPAEFETEPLLTGEHVFPWMFEDYQALAPFRDAAQILAEREWPRLYDPGVLEANEVPAAALIYSEDMYVERTFSEETADRIPHLRMWLTSEYDHNGLHVEGDRILGRLLGLARGLI